MKRNQRAVIVAVAVIGLLFFVLNRDEPEPEAAPPVQVSVEPTPSPVAPPVEKVEVLFARKRIPRYTFLDHTNITDLLIQQKGVPKNILPNVKLARKFDDVKGLIVLDDINRGEPMVIARLAKPGEVGGVSFHIDKGKRAVTVRVDRVRGVSGFVNQGDFVDILGTFTGTGGSPLTRYVLQNVKILAINTTFVNPEILEKPKKPAEEKPKGGGEGDKKQQGPKDRVVAGDLTLATFELTPQDAEKLVLAENSGGRLYLALRSPGDKEPTNTLPVDDVDLYTSKAKKEPVPKINIYIWKGTRAKPSVAPVRVDPSKLRDSPGQSDLNIYLDLEEEPIRDIKDSDFR